LAAGDEELWVIMIDGYGFLLWLTRGVLE